MIEIKKPVMIKGRRYEVGEEYKPAKDDMPLVIRLNEKGFIKPLNSEELLNIFSSFNLPKKENKESEKNDTRKYRKGK